MLQLKVWMEYVLKAHVIKILLRTLLSNTHTAVPKQLFYL